MDNGSWRTSSAGFRGPAYLVDYLEQELRDGLTASGVAADEPRDFLVLTLLLVELLRSGWRVARGVGIRPSAAPTPTPTSSARGWS